MCPGRGRGNARGDRHSNYHLQELRNASPEIWKSSLKHFLPSLTSAHWISLLIPSTPLYSLMALSRLWYSLFSQGEDTGLTEMPSVPRTISYMVLLPLSLSPSPCLSTSVLSCVSTRWSYCWPEGQRHIVVNRLTCKRVSESASELVIAAPNLRKRLSLCLRLLIRALLVPRAWWASVCLYMWENRRRTAYKVGQGQAGGEAGSQCAV